MGRELQAIDRTAADSLIGWWLESGVDIAVSEFPRGWLRQNDAGRAAHSAPSMVSTRPADLAAFQQWLATAPGLPMDRPGASRVAPRGIEGSAIMLLSDMPDAGDAADGVPIAGEAWLLATRMLAAIGFQPSDAYVGSLCCFQSPGARLGREELAGCAEIARDHIRLARPKRLLLLGDAPARGLLGEPLARARGRIHRIEGIPTVATFHPRWLLQRTSDKALAWSDLLLLMSEND